MSTEVKLRRGTAAENAGFTGGQGEVIYITDEKTLALHDGATPGGEKLITGSFALNRANHTGTQAISTVAGLEDELDDRVSKEDAGLFAGTRNRLINGGFDIAQRATSLLLSAGQSAYLLDRWLITNGTDKSVTISREVMALGQIVVPGNPKYFLRATFATAPTSGSLRIAQRVESVLSLSGRAASARLYVTGPAGVEVLGCEVVQNFGTGGFPSGQVTTPASLDIATIFDAGTRQRRAQVTVPPIAGKTLGTNGNDYVELAWILTPRQAAAYDIARASFIEGDTSAEADPFSARHISSETALCQRYFQWLPFNMQFWQVGATTQVMVPMVFPVAMRAAPAVAAITADPNTTQQVQNNSYNAFLNITAFGAAAVLRGSTSASNYVFVVGFRAAADAEL